MHKFFFTANSSNVIQFIYPPPSLCSWVLQQSSNPVNWLENKAIPVLQHHCSLLLKRVQQRDGCSNCTPSQQHHIITPHQPKSLPHPTAEQQWKGFPVPNDRPVMSWQTPWAKPNTDNHVLCCMGWALIIWKQNWTESHWHSNYRETEKERRKPGCDSKEEPRQQAKTLLQPGESSFTKPANSSASALMFHFTPTLLWLTQVTSI